MQVMKEETLKGHIVIGMGMFGHNEPDFDMDGPVKKMLDELHLRKIDLADEVVVIAPMARKCPRCGRIHLEGIPGPILNGATGSICGGMSCGTPCSEDMASVLYAPYVGESTNREIRYALDHNKPVSHRLFRKPQVNEVKVTYDNSYEPTDVPRDE